MTVDAWLFRTARKQDEGRMAACLSAEERARAARFRLESDRTRYINAHGILRQILASYLDVDGASLRITQAGNGKPGLDAQHGAHVQFSLSHSGQYGIVAVSTGGPVGVDVEAIREGFPWSGVAERYFSRRENGWLRTHPSDEALRWFFRLWVAKEAVLKASGVGLSAALHEVEPPRGVPGITAASGEVFWVSEFAVADGYVAALAVSGTDTPTVRRMSLTSSRTRAPLTSFFS